jgi:hypothetical protein
MLPEMEVQVADTFKQLVAALPERVKREWMERLENDIREAQEIFSKPSDPERRYRFLVKIDSYLSGRDSLTDFVDERRGALRTIQAKFHDLRWALLRDYWRQLGRPSYDYATFAPYAKGSLVRVVPDVVTYFRLDGTGYLPPSMYWSEILHSSKPAPTVAEIVAVTWTVKSVYGPDITNMPFYWCGGGMVAGNRRGIYIRHEALRERSRWEKRAASNSLFGALLRLIGRK